jgi:hypothetical protein
VVFEVVVVIGVVVAAVAVVVSHGEWPRCLVLNSQLGAEHGFRPSRGRGGGVAAFEGKKTTF